MRALMSLLGVLSVALSGMFAPPPAAAAPQVLKLACDSPVGLATDRGVKLFKQLVEERSHGKYRVDIFDGQSFGSPETVYQALMFGSLHFVSETTSQLSSMVPALQLFDCPGIFPDSEAAEAIIRGPVGEQLLKDMSDKNILFHGFTRPLARVIWTRTPAADLADLKGRKIRTTSGKMHIAAVKALGMTPIPMAWSEIFTSLQQGVVDGQDTAIALGARQNLAEVSPYIVESDYIIFSEVMATGTKWWNKLSEEDKAMFSSCMKDMFAHIQEGHRADMEQARGMIEKQGGHIVTPDEQEKRKWFAETRNLYKEFDTIKPEWVNSIHAALRDMGKLQ